jgi:hypothetical protein
LRVDVRVGLAVGDLPVGALFVGDSAFCGTKKCGIILVQESSGDLTILEDLEDAVNRV